MFDTLTADMAAASRAFEAAFARGDVPAMIVAYYTRDPTVIGEGVSVFRGRDGARAYFDGAVGGFRACHFATARVERLGSSALETGVATLTPRDEGKLPVSLAYAVVWEHEPGTGWRVAVDYFSPGEVSPHF